MIIRATALSDARAVSCARILQSRLFDLSAALATATLALSTVPQDQVRYAWAPPPAVSTVSDEALPGGGRPPAPGPTDPDDLAR